MNIKKLIHVFLHTSAMEKCAFKQAIIQASDISVVVIALAYELFLNLDHLWINFSSRDRFICPTQQYLYKLKKKCIDAIFFYYRI